MDKIVSEALALYVTNRDAFNDKYAGTPIPAFCDELMMQSESRPHSAERIAILLMGHQIHREKKYDGEIHVDGKLARYSEYKVTCRYSDADGTFPRMSSINHNDVSPAIVERYRADQPLFVFPFFLDGHLAAMFSVEFSVLQPKYEALLTKRSVSADSRSVLRLAQADWLDQSKVEFVHSDPKVVQMLSKSLQAKIYRTNNIPQIRSNSMSSIIRFPAGHRFERYGYDFTTEDAYSFASDPQGRIVKVKYRIADTQVGEFNINDLREEAARVAGIALPTPKRPSPLQRIKTSTSAPVAQAPSNPIPAAPVGTLRMTVEFPNTMSVDELVRKLHGTGAKITITA